jgi:membrane protease YdiL (CAAX protease family)
VRSLLAYLGAFLIWSLGASVAVTLGARLQHPVLGLGATLALAAAFVEGYLLRGPRPSRRRALLRLRPLPAATVRWVAVAVPVVLLTAWTLEQVWTQLVPVPPESFDPFESLTRTPLQRLAIMVLAVALAPVLEEFFFRGLIQRTLERRVGPHAGIAVAAALFAGLHFLPWVFPLHFFLGVTFGYAVRYTGSIWAGVVLHAANNAVAVLGIGERPTAMPTVWATGPTAYWWESLLMLAASLALLAWTARGMRDAGRLRGPARAG